ncbi:hypothetical protein CYL21_3086 [Plasmodium falciparum NF54]|uniref:Uncharacterized protein n=2 Tax=Plasmodium falciparum TaxID=5833 RepID=O77337_PLAF7|nr:conserved Plasmodium protein, unknown function [Plasmodium falciparum 3D7]KAF4328874.1 hypothetical protein CYL21_3086 [Plasmodium falciparum NF54]PKC45305.1 hypothetical protein CK202_3655 [Plasmodium falciparum NF54]CAA15592.2 conserved Plasmodium protein, unknown function [Plasmodium falciparum 3D7]|eukprot:XP_001351206.1 conserved Plasmodium protein, unknown function [Plasmodium falciparum 3D7]
MKNLNIISNKIVEDRVKEYCRKIEENKLKNVKPTIKFERNKININNKKKLYLEKLRNEEIERNNNILKKKLEGINKREKKNIEQNKQTGVQKVNTNKKNFLAENIKKAKLKKEKTKTNHSNVTLNDHISIKNMKKIVYKGYVDDSKKSYKFYTELKVDEESNLSILALNLKNKRIKKFFYNKEKHHELLSQLHSYDEIAKSITLIEEENGDKNKKVSSNKKETRRTQNEKPMRIKDRVMMENIEKTCDFYIKKYFNEDLEDNNFLDNIDKMNSSDGKQSNDLLNFKKRKNSFLLMKNEILYKSKINEAQALLIFQKIKEKLKKNKNFIKSSKNMSSFVTKTQKENNLNGNKNADVTHGSTSQDRQINNEDHKNVNNTQINEDIQIIKHIEENIENEHDKLEETQEKKMEDVAQKDEQQIDNLENEKDTEKKEADGGEDKEKEGKEEEDKEEEDKEEEDKKEEDKKEECKEEYKEDCKDKEEDKKECKDKEEGKKECKEEGKKECKEECKEEGKKECKEEGKEEDKEKDKEENNEKEDKEEEINSHLNIHETNYDEEQLGLPKKMESHQEDKEDAVQKINDNNVDMNEENNLNNI